MSSPGKNNLTCQEVCSILESCKVNGVFVLKFKDLFVQMGSSVHATATPGDYGSLPPESAEATPTAEEMAAIQKELAEKALEKDELDLRADQVANLLIEDPLEAERLLINGELEDADDSDADDEY